jgi:hypothetical protein
MGKSLSIFPVGKGWINRIDCGFVEFVLADPVIEQLRKGPFDAQLGAA